MPSTTLKQMLVRNILNNMRLMMRISEHIVSMDVVPLLAQTLKTMTTSSTVDMLLRRSHDRFGLMCDVMYALCMYIMPMCAHVHT
jgi:hypothetical protein